MKRIKQGAHPIRALGAMSGTSLDGVDAAVIETDGVQIFATGESAYRPYSADERAILTAALGKWDGADVEAAAQIVDRAHCEILADFDDVDLIGFHGQTLAHAPRTHGTLQIGNGAALAQALATPVVWDFRSADVALGGEGAPLIPFYHWACARAMGGSAPVAFLNLGGVGNLTWVDPRAPAPESQGALLAFDTGPANAPVNDLMWARRGQPYDQDGTLAQSGDVIMPVLEDFLNAPFFSRMPPKSLDRNEFHDILTKIKGLSDADAAATLTAMAAAAVASAAELCPTSPQQIFVSGGGRKNPVMMKMLQAALECPLQPVEAIGLDGDMLEAQAFAYLAVRVARGLPTSCPGTTGVQAAVAGGTLSWPQGDV